MDIGKDCSLADYLSANRSSVLYNEHEFCEDEEPGKWLVQKTLVSFVQGRDFDDSLCRCDDPGHHSRLRNICDPDL